MDYDYLSHKLHEDSKKQKPKKNKEPPAKFTNNNKTRKFGKSFKAKDNKKAKHSINNMEDKELETNTSFEINYKATLTKKSHKKMFVNFRDSQKCTALYAAGVKGSLEAVKILIYNGASLFIRDCKDRVCFQIGY